MAREGNEGRGLEDFLTVGQAAAMLGVTATTLRNWDRSGKLKARRHPINRYRLYERAAIQRLLNQIRRSVDD